MIKIVLAIRSLDRGGAERQFIELIKGLDKRRFKIFVFTMYGGELECELEKIDGIYYRNLQKKSRYDFVGFMFRYWSEIKKIKPHLIYSFLGEMNIFSLFCKTAKAKIIWGFRASDMDLRHYDRFSKVIFTLQKVLSKRVECIVANSYASVHFHSKNKYYMGHAFVIHNGIDTHKFVMNEEARKVFRSKYKLSEDDIAIGIAARIDPMKGYPIFAEAVLGILKKNQNIKVFAIGAGDDNIKKRCAEILGHYNDSRFIWLGKRGNMEKLYCGLDCLVSSSIFGEGFSNSIAEAMSCEVPCVVTDVGDSRMIVGDTGIVVPPGDVNALAAGILELINGDMQEMGRRARTRVVQKFSLEKMVKKTEEVITKCVE